MEGDLHSGVGLAWTSCSCANSEHAIYQKFQKGAKRILGSFPFQDLSINHHVRFCLSALLPSIPQQLSLQRYITCVMVAIASPVRPRRMAPAAKAMASLREDSALAETSTGCLAGLGTLALRAWTCEFAHETIIAIFKGSWSTQELELSQWHWGLRAYQRDLDEG